MKRPSRRSSTRARAVGESGDAAAATSRAPAAHVVVVIVGGATYSEAEAVRAFNATRRRAERRSHAVLGAPEMLSTARFVSLLRAHAEAL